MSTTSMPPKDNVDPAEIAKFERIANQWWDTEGQFKPLHKMNPLRANHIDLLAPVAGKKILDVGCGGGLLCEALAHRGGLVTGIDLGAEPLSVAQAHAQQNQLEINYQLHSAESYAKDHAGQFDIVTCLEMLEHVPDPASVVQACFELVKPEGDVFFSTINRNAKSYALAILAAEYALKWVPKGTHEYRQFIKPSELAKWARNAGLRLCNHAGIVYNPLTRQFRIDPNDVDVNYIMHFKKVASL